MSFWKNVEAEREYRNISRKELATRADFAVSGISLGLSHDSVPSADVAVRIANVLNVSVEYLVSGGEDSGGEKLSPQVAHLLESAKSLSLFDIETVQLLVDRLRKRG